jgi:hypothetical protein
VTKIVVFYIQIKGHSKKVKNIYDGNKAKKEYNIEESGWTRKKKVVS